MLNNVLNANRQDGMSQKNMEVQPSKKIKTRVSIALKPQQIVELGKLCDKLCVDRSEFIRSLIIEELEKAKK